MSTPSSYVYRDPLALPRIGLDDILRNCSEGVWIEPPGQRRAFVREPPAFHDDPDGVGLFPPFRRERILAAPNFIVSLRDATLMGFRSLMTPDGFFTNDFGHLSVEDAGRFAAGLPGSVEMEGLVFDGRGFAPERAREEVRLSGTVVLLSSLEPGNWGSFLYRDLVKLVDLPALPQDWRFLADVPQASFRQMLALAGLPMERLIPRERGVPYRMDHAVVIGLRTPYAFADRATRRFYDGLGERAPGTSQTRRIFISRGTVNAERRRAGRILLNEEEAISRLRALDFEIVEPQLLTAADQIAAFRAADLVVGPSGSGMFGAVFCRPGTKLIDIESEPHWIFPHACLFASAGLEYGVFEGVANDRDFRQHHKPWTVNVDALVRRIETFAPRAAPAPAVPGAPFWSRPDHAGVDHIVALRALHEALRPQTYLEIGVSPGASLALARCATIGVDPAFAFDRPFMDRKPSCLLFQTTSEDFFRSHDPTALLGRPTDLAFLDGAHEYESVLRDFLEVERHCTAHSVVVLHNVLPTDDHVGRRDVNDMKRRSRSRHPDWWAGDGWKALALLRQRRPDLRIVALDAPPAGLVAIAGLNPKSEALGAWRAWAQDARDWTLAAEGETLLAGLDIRNAEATISEDLISLLRPG